MLYYGHICLIPNRDIDLTWPLSTWEMFAVMSMSIKAPQLLMQRRDDMTKSGRPTYLIVAIQSVWLSVL